MGRKYVLDNALIVNEGASRSGHVIIDGQFIDKAGEGRYHGDIDDVRDLGGKLLIPGVIDTHVHFREPGLTRKADIASESRAAAAGGVTSFFDMPNCIPQTTSQEALDEKHHIAAASSAVNYSFYIGASPGNLNFLANADYSKIPGIKLFLGQSTGGMLVGGDGTLDAIFSLPRIISIHSEDQWVIDRNTKAAIEKYGKGNVPVSLHPVVRSAEACMKCTSEAVQRAERLNARLHICHISTADELALLDKTADVDGKRITAEVCVQHLWFCDDDYSRLGSKIKCNPSIKSAAHRDMLRRAVADGTIDVVSTDHAPHELKDKEGDGLTAASGIPLVQYSLQAMIDLSNRGWFSLERVVETMCHNPARVFAIDRRGFIRPGYYADLAIIDLDTPHTVTTEDIRSKCGWSPFEGHTFSSTIAGTIVNGGTGSMPLRFGTNH